MMPMEGSINWSKNWIFLETGKTDLTDFILNRLCTCWKADSQTGMLDLLKVIIPKGAIHQLSVWLKYLIHKNQERLERRSWS